MLDKIPLEVDEKKWAEHPRAKVGSKKEVPKAEKMTPELLKRREFRMNKPFIPPRVYFNTEAE